MIRRTLESSLRASRKSLLLLGPRQTGKSTLVAALEPDLTINLAHEPTFLEFARNPEELEQRLAAKRGLRAVFLDEIQRLPSLLNTIQSILDRSGAPRFYLTGSSARKLRRGQANLLPGRVHAFHLGPLVSAELGRAMDSHAALSTGTLPGIYLDRDRRSREKTLSSYAATYLKEEIQAESLARNIEGFSRFLHVAAACAGSFLDLSKLASEAGVARQSAVRFFEILEDTLIVRRADAFSRSARRRLVQHPRYFFFDTGVLNGVLGNFEPSPDRIGNLMEHLVFNQIVHTASSLDQDIRVSSFRTEHGAEVDFIVETRKETWAVEVKAGRSVGKHDLRGLERFRGFYGKKCRAAVLYLGAEEKRIEDVEILPWQLGLERMGL
jgi:uncharacterized protein